MERRAECTQRQEELHRHQYQEQRVNRRKSAIRRPGNSERYPQSGAAVCHHIHDRGTCQLHYQDLHGDLPEFLRAAVHLLMPGGVRTEYFQLAQSLYAVQEAVAHRSVLPPVFREYLLGVLRHRDDGHWDKRYAADKRHRHPPVDPYCRQEKHKRRQHGIEELRNIRGIVQVKLLDPLHCHLGQPGNAHSIGAPYSQPYYFVVGLFPEVLFSFPAENIPQISGNPARGITHDYPACRQQRRHEVGCRLRLLRQQIYRCANPGGNREIRQKPSHHDRHGVKYVFSVAAQKPQQFLIQHVFSPFPTL